MDKIKIGMISFAHMHALSYLDALVSCDGVEITGIADQEFGRVKPFLEKYNLRWYSEYKELLKTDVDAVIICTENVLHAKVTEDAAKAKKHILCEKPMAVSEDQLLRMIAVCEAHGVQFMTSFPNRYIPMIIKARQDIHNGLIGDIIGVKATNKGAMPGGWFIDKKRSGGGSVMDHTTHVADLLNWILDCNPVEVYAQAATLLYDIDVEDTAIINIKYANGVFASLDASWSRKGFLPYDRDLTLEFVGTLGVISIDYFAQSNSVYSSSAGKEQYSYFGDNKDDLLIRDFVSCIRTGRKMPINAEDGAKATMVALKAYESIKLKRTVKM
jgi:predicted dehydrogenase